MKGPYCRTPVVEIILDELINDIDVLSSFLKVLSLSQHTHVLIHSSRVRTRTCTHTLQKS